MSPGNLNAFPIDFIRPLPPFNADGFLNPGDYAPTRAEFEERFVETGDIQRRRFMYDGLNRYRTALQKAGIPESAWMLVNGSFTTRKHSPKDIDIAVEVPIATIEAMANHPAADLFRGGQILLSFQCHAFSIFSLPVKDPNYALITGEYLKFWTKLFSSTRNGNSKGRIWIKTGECR